MIKHTPGPWTLASGGNIMAPAYFGFTVASTETFTGRCVCSEEERQANGRLISACPELLDALRESLDAVRLAGIHQHPDGGDLPWYANGLAVLAKAENSPCDPSEIVSTGAAASAWGCNK